MNQRGWLVWSPDRVLRPEEGKRIHPSGAGAHCVRDAALLYAEDHADWNGDPFDEIRLHVRDEDNGRVTAVTIAVAMVPEFRISEISAVDALDGVE